MPDGDIGDGTVTKIGEQTIICGNCIDVMRRWGREPVDIVVTSPPYNLNLAYGTYDDSKTEEDYIEWLAEVASSIKGILKPEGSFFLNISGSNSRPYIPFLAMPRLRKEGFHLQNHITWIKSIGIGSESTGHFKPVNGRRFMHHNHEHVFHLTLDNGVELDRLAIGLPFQDKSNIARRGHARDLRCRGNTWFIPYPTVKSKAQKYWHPATFPVELPLWCIYLHGRPPATVLDPFLGTGTTLVAAHYAGARGIGIDVDPTYIDTARRRVAEAVEDVVLVVLSKDEMAMLFRQDEEKRTAGGWQSRIVSFQQRLNKSTGELALTEEDVAWIKRYGSRPQDGSWQRWLNIAFASHIDLSHPG
jgi:site-specific DNA-methyltransferase (adenine-specific)